MSSSDLYPSLLCLLPLRLFPHPFLFLWRHLYTGRKMEKRAKPKRKTKQNKKRSIMYRSLVCFGSGKEIIEAAVVVQHRPSSCQEVNGLTAGHFPPPPPPSPRSIFPRSLRKENKSPPFIESIRYHRPSHFVVDALHTQKSKLNK